MVKIYEFIDKSKFEKLFADLVSRTDRAQEAIGIFSEIMEEFSDDELISFLQLRIDRCFYELLVDINKMFSRLYANIFGKWKNYKEESP